MKIRILLMSFFISISSHANSLHDNIRNCETGIVDFLLKNAYIDPKFETFKADVIETSTNKTPLEVAEECQEEKERNAIKDLINQALETYNATTKNTVSVSIENRSFPKFSENTRVNFIANEDIIEIISFDNLREKRVGENEVARLSSGKWVVQQRDSSRCGQAAVIMRELDLEIENISSWHFGREGCYASDIKSELERVQLKTILTTICISSEKDVENMLLPKLKELVLSYGPVIALASINGFGHWIIVDEIDEAYAIIRDPWHGWRVKIKLEALGKSFYVEDEEDEPVSLISLTSLNK